MIAKSRIMDIDKYIESMHPVSEKERKKLKRILSEYSVYDNKNGIREVRVPKGFYIPFQGNLYSWSDLMHTAMLKIYHKGFRDEAGLVVDEHELLWLKIHTYDSVYDDDLEVYFPVKDANHAEALYDQEGPNITKYFWKGIHEDLVIPHFRFNDGPYLYLATHDLTLSKDEMFDQLVTCNILYY